MKTSHHNPHLSPRKSHRKRGSVSRLSCDTISTLPEYSSSPVLPTVAHPDLSDDRESESLPDYSSVTHDGDGGHVEDHKDIAYFPQRLTHSPKRRSLAHTRRRRRTPLYAPMANSSLDTLLERSIHALEVSNTLLQTSILTQTSPHTVLSPVENEPDRTLEVRARNLSTRIRGNGGVHTSWMDHLEELSQGVDCLLHASSTEEDGAVSRSLPTPTVPQLRHRRKPSLLELNGSSSSSSQLQYSLPNRDMLVAPPPRALTQYVESTTNPELIVLPSTLGDRSSQFSHRTDLRCRSPDLLLHSPPSEDPPSESASGTGTSAYLLLSDLARRSDMTPHPFYQFWGSRSKGRSTPHITPSASRPSTPEREISPVPHSPIEEFPDSSSESSSSSDHPTGYRAMESLRRILLRNPSSLSVDHTTTAPKFLPVTSPTPVSATSAATASVSRLLTKGRHSLSTRPHSPPPHSSLKVRSGPPTPAQSSSTLSVVDLFGSGVAKAFGSGPSSSSSTPKRITFAELPESYSSSRPTSARFREKKEKKKRERKGKEAGASSGIMSWLVKELISAPPPPKWQEESMEERMSRGWGSRPTYGWPDDWAV